MLGLMHSSGLRISGVVNVKVKDFDFDNKLLDFDFDFDNKLLRV